MSDENTTPPAEQSDAAIEASLFAQAKAYDAGTPVETPAAADAQPTPTPETTQSGNAPAANQQTPTPPKPATPAPATEQQPAAPQQSQFQQKRSDKERNERSWQKLNEEKEAFRKEREEFYRKQAEQARGGQSPQPSSPAPTASTDDPLAAFTPEQLEQAAVDFDKKGQFDMAEAARQAAKQKRAQPQPPPQQAPAPQQQDPALAAAHAEWKANLAAIEKENPEIADKTSPMHRETFEVLKNYPVLRTYPGGIKDAVALVKLQREAGAAATLRKEVEGLKARLAQAEGRLVPAVGAPESGIRPKAITEMDDAAAEAELKRQAAAIDAGG
ncbi:MAG TPA: hypothetical protein VK178_07205 [Opitutaceae bacterium]|nr:hypothetical protein [Opitutaceae bacterium]